MNKTPHQPRLCSWTSRLGLYGLNAHIVSFYSTPLRSAASLWRFVRGWTLTTPLSHLPKVREKRWWSGFALTNGFHPQNLLLPWGSCVTISAPPRISAGASIWLPERQSPPWGFTNALVITRLLTQHPKQTRGLLRVLCDDCDTPLPQPTKTIELLKKYKAHCWRLNSPLGYLVVQRAGNECRKWYYPTNPRYMRPSP